MSLVVLDIECIDNKIIKELGVFQDGKTTGYAFLPPKKFKPTNQTHWYTKNLHGINWGSGKTMYSQLEPILKSLITPETEFFAKGLEKCKILQDILNYKVDNLDDLSCPKAQNLIFRDNDNSLVWDCSNYPIRHKSTMHCAERKAFVYGLWTQNFFNKL